MVLVLDNVIFIFIICIDLFIVDLAETSLKLISCIAPLAIIITAILTLRKCLDTRLIRRVRRTPIP